MTVTEGKLEQCGTVDLLDYRKMLIPGYLGMRQGLTFQSPSVFASGSMEATTFSEMSTSPVLLSVTCEDHTRRQSQPASLPHLPLSCQEGQHEGWQ